MRNFISIGENIHCTRMYRTDGDFVDQVDGHHVILYRDAEGARRHLPVPVEVTQGDQWRAGKVRHCAVALRLVMQGDAGARDAGVDYLQALARRQQLAGVDYLDVNVDEFSADPAARCVAMQRLVDILQPALKVPLCIDSSNIEVLRTGLDSCARHERLPVPMLNSVSLERKEAIDLAVRCGAPVVASAAGEHDLPCDTAGRMDNLARLMALLHDAAIRHEAIYIDPLVLPIATDSRNALGFIETVRAVRAEYGPAIHIVGGFSNVSFGMPCRKLINAVFTRLALEAGADGGIVDPFQINLRALDQLDPAEPAYVMAQRLLLGEDEFGAEFIMAHREGRLTDR